MAVYTPPPGTYPAMSQGTPAKAPVALGKGGRAGTPPPTPYAMQVADPSQYRKPMDAAASAEFRKFLQQNPGGLAPDARQQWFAARQPQQPAPAPQAPQQAPQEAPGLAQQIAAAWHAFLPGNRPRDPQAAPLPQQSGQALRGLFTKR